jgi:hypothetical protein
MLRKTCIVCKKKRYISNLHQFEGIVNAHWVCRENKCYLEMSDLVGQLLQIKNKKLLISLFK